MSITTVDHEARIAELERLLAGQLAATEREAETAGKWLLAYQEAFAQAQALEAENKELRDARHRRTIEFTRLTEQAQALQRRVDTEMLRLKACEHIADGDEGWERLRNECPSTMSVATLRQRLTDLEAESREWASRYDQTVQFLQERCLGLVQENEQNAYEANECAKELFAVKKRLSDLEAGVREALDDAENSWLTAPGRLEQIKARLRARLGASEGSVGPEGSA